MKKLKHLFTDSDEDSGEDGPNNILTAGLNRGSHSQRSVSGSARPATDAIPPLSRSQQDEPQSSPSSAMPLSMEAGRSRRNMQSLFAQDSLQSQQAHTTSLRYEEEARQQESRRQVAAAVAGADGARAQRQQERRADPRWDMDEGSDGASEGGEHHSRAARDGGGGGDRGDSDDDEDALYARRKHVRRGKPSTTAPRTTSTASPSPLVTVTHAVVQAYRGENYVGTCAAALCAPNTRPHKPTNAAVSPLLAIVDATKRTLCRAPLCDALHLHLSRENPQYVSFMELPHRMSSDEAKAEHGDGTSRSEGKDQPGDAQGTLWSVMFKDRREAIAFVAAAHTLTRFAPDTHPAHPGLSGDGNVVSLLQPPPNSDDDDDGKATEGKGADGVVQPGGRVLLGYRLWILQRVAKGSPYWCLGKSIDEVPAEAPAEVRAGAGVLMDGLEKGVLGMPAGAARLLFLAPGETRVRRGVGNPEVAEDDTVVAYVYCVEVGEGNKKGAEGPPSGAFSKGRNGGGTRGLPADIRQQHSAEKAVPAAVPQRKQADGAPSAAPTAAAAPLLLGGPPPPAPAAPAVPADDTTALLQRALLQTLLSNSSNSRPAQEGHGGSRQLPASEQPQSANLSSADRDVITSTAAAVTRVEHATDRIQGQLLHVTDKLDRLDLRRVLEENNAVLEKMLRRVVGLAPQDENALIEDAHKDRDALLATLEKYKARYEEANGQYQQALEGVGRYADKVHALEADLRLQKETLEARLAQSEERSRLRAVEADVKHRAELDRATEEAFRRGREEGFARGVKQGTAEALQAAGQPVDQNEWKEKSFRYEQEIMKWKTELQEAQGRHIRERRSLQAELDSLQLLCQRMGAQQEDLALRVPEDSAEQQCKRLKRALNAVYAQVEAQLAAHTAPTQAKVGVPTETDGSLDMTAGALPPSQSSAGVEGTVTVRDALSALIIAVKSEAKVFTREIKAEAALRGLESEMLAQVRRERREKAAAVNPPSTSDTNAEDVLSSTATATATAASGEALTGEPVIVAATGPVGELDDREARASDLTVPPATGTTDIVSDPRSMTRLGADEAQRATQPFDKPAANAEKTTTDLLPSRNLYTALVDEGAEAPTVGEAPPQALLQVEQDARLSNMDPVSSSSPLTARSSASPSPDKPQTEAPATGNTEDGAAPQQPWQERELGVPVEAHTAAMTQGLEAGYRPTPPPAAGAAPGEASHASDSDATPMGRPAVRLDYGSAQTPRSYAQSAHEDSQRTSPPSAPFSSDEGRGVYDGGDGGGRRVAVRRVGTATAAAADSPIPAFYFQGPLPPPPPSASLWSAVNPSDPFDVSNTPNSELRGRDTSAPLPTRGTVLLPPPSSLRRGREPEEEDSFEHW